MDNQDKKQRILDATLRLITERGFHGTPVAQIAIDAEVGTGTIYRYFDSKEAIINELYRLIESDLHEATLRDIPPQVTVRDEFYLKWRNILRYFLDHPSEAKFIEQYAASPFIRPQLIEENKRRNAHLQVLMTRGIDSHEIRPVDYNTVTVFMWGTIKQLHYLFDSGQAAITEDLINEIFCLFWEGIRWR